MSVTNCISYFL